MAMANSYLLLYMTIAVVLAADTGGMAELVLAALALHLAGHVQARQGALTQTGPNKLQRPTRCVSR